jgi:hypothetical protein
MKDPLDLMFLAKRERIQDKYDESTEFMNKMTEEEIDEWVASVNPDEIIQKMIDYNILYHLFLP